MNAERVLERLVAGGALDRAKADRATDAARKEGIAVGRWLVDAGWVRAEDWARGAAAVLGLEFRDSVSGSDEILSRWPMEFFRKHRCAPLEQRNGSLLVAVSDPTDRENLDAVEAFVRMPLAVVCAAEAAIRVRLAGESKASDAPGLELDAPQDEPHLRLLHEVLRSAIERGATDVHVVSKHGASDVRLRLDGLLAPPAWNADSATSASLVNRVRVLAGMDLTETRLPQDGSFTLRTRGRSIDVRASLVPAQGGASIVLRLLDRERLGTSLSLDRLGVLPPERETILAALRRPHGLVVVTGPTGSGKSTTLYAALSEAADPAKKLVTIEDPVEYRLADAVQVEVNERAGLTFASGLRSILRHDPDRILVGEIRDAETAAIAIQAALTGHLVLTTLHATSSADVGARLAALGVDEGSLARCLSVLIAQRLVRRICGACSADGCAACERTGFRGRLALVEAGVRPIREIAREHLAAKVTTEAEIRRVWPEALS